MSHPDTQTTTRLWTETGFRDDPWTHAPEFPAGEAAANTGVILPLAAYLALDAKTRKEHAGAIGVHVEPGEAVEALLPHLPLLPLVSLGFPAFNDGRSYSKAELLRSRHGYEGEIRASGDVLIDQIPLMLRTGFSQFEVSNPTALRRLEEGRVGGLSFNYQPTAASPREARGYAWRRLSPARGGA